MITAQPQLYEKGGILPDQNDCCCMLMTVKFRK